MRIFFFFCSLVLFWRVPGMAAADGKFRIVIIGLAHGHVSGFLEGSAIVPAGGAMHRQGVEIVGISDPDKALFEKYSRRDHLPAQLYFANADVMLEKTHPDAAFIFTNTFEHTEAVLSCARHKVHAMMEKPFAVDYSSALTMAKAAKDSGIHLLVDYETTWYASNGAAYEFVNNGSLGALRKVIVRDGHAGPKLIHVQPEFFNWLTDPKLNGAGALFDFGCYGADLMTWLMHGEEPETVSAVARHLQPEFYPNVDDEADVILTYPKAVAILQPSWDWPFNVKDMDVYGATGYVKTLKADQIEVRLKGEDNGQVKKAKILEAPNDDPINYLEAVIEGRVSENGSLSSLSTNVIASEILDAARQSVASGRAIRLPLTAAHK